MERIVPNLLAKHAETRADQAAITALGGKSATYGELHMRSDQLARYFLKQGLAEGDRVALCFTNPTQPDFAAAYFGVQKAGGVVVPLNARLTRDEAAGTLDHSQARFVMYTDGLTGEVLGAFPEGALKFQETLAKAETLGDDAIEIALTEEGPAELIYTSGTTGTPKGVLASHTNVVGSINPMYEQMLGGKRLLNPLPLHTFAGMAHMVFSIKNGMENVVLEKFDPKVYVDALENENITTCYAVSSMWLKILNEVEGLEDRDFSSVLSLSFGAAPMPSWAVTRLGEIFTSSMIFNVYGLTEAGGAACMLLPGDHIKRPGSVGVPVADCEVRIMSEEGTEVPTGERGEILIKMSGVKPRQYFRDEEASTKTWDADGFTHTGDIGYRDEDGYLYIVDRKKDIIIQGGNNVSSLEVEETLTQHEDIAEVAVVGLPHDTLGEQVTAWYVTKPGATPDPSALKEYLKAKLSPYKVPKQFFPVEELPRNAMGKVRKAELRERGRS